MDLHGDVRPFLVGLRLGQAMRDPSLYANADSLLMELRALVADFKANPRRYVNLRIF